MIPLRGRLIIAAMMVASFCLGMVYSELGWDVCRQRIAAAFSRENICKALDHRWVDLGHGGGECLSPAMLTQLGVD